MLYSLMENVFLKFGFEVPGKVLDSLFSLSQGLPEKQNRKEIIYINIKYVANASMEAKKFHNLLPIN